MFRRKFLLVILSILVCLSMVAAWGLTVAQAVQSAPGSAQAIDPEAVPGSAPQAPDVGQRQSATGGDMLVSTPAELHPASTAVAYNPDDDQFMIVAATYQGVLAQIYASNGVPVGDGIVITNHHYVEQPDLAYSTTRHEYMLVWGHLGEAAGGQRHIYGQRLSRSGLLLDNPSTAEDESIPGVNFPVSTIPIPKNRPSIAYNSLDDEYLVVWWHTDSIYGQRVDDDGYLLDNPSTSADEHDPAVSFIISGANGAQDEPDVIYNTDDNEYLVVWQDQRDLTRYGIFGQRIDANGDLLDNPGTPEVETDPSTNFLIHRLAAFDAKKPSGAYNTHLRQYLVAWAGYSSSATIIAGDRLSRLGAPLDDPNTTYADESLTNLAMSLINLQGYSLSPALVYNPERQEYLVAFTYSELENDSANRRILASRLTDTGWPKSPFDFTVSTSLAADPPALAYGPATGQYLIAWPHYNASISRSDHILAQRVWWPSLLLGHEFNALPAWDDQKLPAVAYNSRDHESLVVWEDWRGGDSDIYGQRYDRDGLPLGENFLISTDTDNDLAPSVAYSLLENRYLVAWESQDHRYLRYRLLTAQGSFPGSVLIYDSQITNTIFDPVVEYISDPQDNSFFIAYTRRYTSPATSRIDARRVFPSGACQDMVLTNIAAAQYPDLAYNATNNQVYLAFTDNIGSTDQDIKQRIFEPDGTLVEYHDVSIAADAQIHPSVAWNENDNEYLVAWYDYRDSGTQGADIYAARMGSDGLPIGGNFKVSNATGLSSQQYPQVVYANDLDPARYRIVWQDDRTGSYDIRGNWISSLGVVLHAADDPVFSYDGSQLYPTLIYIPSYQRALVAWQDGRSGSEYDIYASFGAVDVTPPTARFTRDPVWGRAGDTFTLNAWPSRDDLSPRGDLLVRWDLTSDGSWDIPLGRDKYITQTVMIPGTYTVTLEVWDRAFNTSQIKHQIFVLPSSSSAPSSALSNPLLSPAASEPPTTIFTVITPTVALAGSTFQFDGRASSGTGTLLGHWDWQNDSLFDTSFTSVLTATHVYTASGDYVVRFEVYDQVTGLSAAALRTLKVLPGPVVSLEILPGDAALIPSESLQWRYQALDIYDNPIFGPPLTWSLLNPLVGQIDSTGIFTASLKYGLYNGVINLLSGGVSDTATVLIYPPFNIYLPLVRR